MSSGITGKPPLHAAKADPKLKLAKPSGSLQLPTRHKT